MASNDKPRDRRDVDALKRAVSLVDVIASYGLVVTPLHKNHVVLCPFHDDQEPSLSIHRTEDGGELWNCFGCKTGGDVLSFIQLYEKVDFKAALARLRTLAGQAPTSPPAAPSEPDASPPAPMPSTARRHELLTAVMAVYQARLREAPEAQAYLQRRGLGSPELWQTFGLGYADGSLLPTLPRGGDTRRALTALGVLSEHGREHFKDCIVVPLSHPDDGLVALYGRRIDGDARRRHLYLAGPQRGVLNWQALQTAAPLYVTEGVLDALSLWAAGVPDVTCIFSAATLPQDLDALLSRFTVRAVRLCLDSDGAGREAASRIQTTLQARGHAVTRVELPEKDANQMLVAHGADALRQAVLSPPPPRPPRATACAPAAQSDTVHASLAGEPPTAGFAMEADGVRYQVTPLPPYTKQLRVRLKSWHGDKHHVDTVDLYNSRSRTMTANGLFRHFGVPKQTLESHFLHILEAAEAWAAQAKTPAEAANVFRGAPVALTEEQLAEAVAYLSQPNLMDALLDDITAWGYVGEDNTKLLAYLIMTSRKLQKPLSGVVLSQSGTGKSSLIEMVEALCCPEDVCFYTRLSATAPSYVPKQTFKHALLILEERAGATQAEYQIRVLQSRALLRQIVTTKDPVTGQMTVQANEVEGPIAYLETTTHPEIDDENANRCFEIVLDESEAQTARIHQQQRWSLSPEGLAQQALKGDVCRRHHLVQRALEPVLVAIPYADALTFPTRWARTRRDQGRFLNLIVAVAFLHQYQRPRGVLSTTGEVYVTATVDDYRIAYQLAVTVLVGTLHDLPQSCQELWAAARAMLAMKTKGGKVYDEPFTRRELRTTTGWPDRRLNENLARLVEMEYVSALSGSQGKTYQYRLLPGGEGGADSLAGLLTPDELEARLHRDE